MKENHAQHAQETPGDTRDIFWLIRADGCLFFFSGRHRRWWVLKLISIRGCVCVFGACVDRISISLQLLSTFSELACQIAVVWLTDRMDTRTLTSSETMRKNSAAIKPAGRFGKFKDALMLIVMSCKNKEELMFFWPDINRHACVMHL